MVTDYFAEWRPLIVILENDGVGLGGLEQVKLRLERLVYVCFTIVAQTIQPQVESETE